MHPLSGSNIATLAQVVLTSGGIPPRQWGSIALIAAAVLGRLPFTWAEKVYMRRRLTETQDMPPPIFIIGHWRSGTTHLYNILSKADFGFVPPLATGLPWDLMIISRLFRPLLEQALPPSRYIDNVPVLPDSPQEDEIALANMTPLSFYHGIYFPKRFDHYLRRGIFFDGCTRQEIEHWQTRFIYFLKKLYLYQDKRQLLIKNPVYTARVAMLHEMMPTAKFIHINRNPYEIFESMRNFYSKLFPPLALQSYDHIPIDNVILDTYKRMMTQLQNDTAKLPPEVYIELRYEDLERNPIGEIERIYRQLELKGFEENRPKFDKYLATTLTYKKNQYSYTEEAAKIVEKNWGAFLDQWGYRRPASTPSQAAN